MRTVGNATADTDCVDCSEGLWREVSLNQTTVAEKEKDVCLPHKVCSAGQWTKKVGTWDTNTVCEDCGAGTFRTMPPKASAPAEKKGDVCTPHKTCPGGTKAAGTLTKDAVCNHYNSEFSYVKQRQK